MKECNVVVVSEIILKSSVWILEFSFCLPFDTHLLWGFPQVYSYEHDETIIMVALCFVAFSLVPFAIYATSRACCPV